MPSLVTASQLQVDAALIAIFQAHFALPATYPGTTTTQSRVSVSSGDNDPSLSSTQALTAETETVEHDVPTSGAATPESQSRADLFAKAVAYVCVLRLRRAYDWGLDANFHLSTVATEVAESLGLAPPATEVRGLAV